LGPSGVDISFSGELRFPNQVLGQFQCGFKSTYYTSIEILGDKGCISIPRPFSPAASSEFHYFPEREPQTIKVKGSELYLGELDDMAECIWHAKKPRISFEDSRSNTKVILACLESARSGKAVKVS
jgi:D-xylose 1-dehydrogenase (NADP+, D-xylono-1,5-lactone-forming)